MNDLCFLIAADMLIGVTNTWLIAFICVYFVSRTYKGQRSKKIRFAYSCQTNVLKLWTEA